MVEYYNRIEGNLENGFVALSDDINSMQENITTALSQIITDIIGPCFVLDSTENAFKLTPATNLIDQQHTIGADWKSLNQLYIIQELDLEKSSVQNAYVQFKNTGGSTGAVTCTLKQPDLFELKDGTVYSSKTILVPAGYTGIFPIPFNVDHLPEGKYELVLKGPEVHSPMISADPNVSVFYDNGTQGGTGYNRGLLESADGYEYEETGYDLWFKTEYGNVRTFDIVSSYAIIRGEKVKNLDTHVTIPVASSYANRRDLVCLDEDGVLNVITGDPATKPLAPDYKVPYGYLKLAEILVKKNQSSASTMKVNQDDTLGEFRLRSHTERIRRLEKLVHWIDVYNSPERIKYTLSGDSFLGDGSTNVAYYADEGYKLSSVQSIQKSWSLAAGADIDAGKTTLDRNTTGQAKLNYISGSGVASVERSYESNKRITNIASYIYGNNSRKSTYPGIYVYISTAGYLRQFASDLRYYKNTQEIWFDCYKVNGGFIERSDSFNVKSHLRGRSYGYDVVRQGGKMHENGMDLSAYGTLNSFSGTKWIEPGWYYFVLGLNPVNRRTRSECLANSWNDSGWPRDFKSRTDFAQFAGWFPLSQGNIILTRRSNRTVVTHAALTSYSKYVSPGTIQCTPVTIDTGVGSPHIQSVSLDINLELPSGTYYKLEVSNNGGEVFHAITGNSYTFTESGYSFVWRLTLYTNDETVTPILKDYDDLGYAVKAVLGLSEDAGNNGCLLTPVLDGEAIIKQALGLTTTVPAGTVQRFSRWEWISVFATGPLTIEDEEETGQRLWLDIETSEDGTNWSKVKAGLRLGDLYHGSVDYSNYDAAYESDEYNYHADTDTNIIADTIPLETFDTNIGEPVQVNGVVSVVEDGNAAKISVAAAAQPGLLWRLTESFDMSQYGQIQLQYSSDVAIMAGALEFVVSSSSNCQSDIIQSWGLPYSKGSWNTETVVFDLENPDDFDNVKSIGIRTRSGANENSIGTAINIKMDNLFGLKTDDYPLVQRYLRLRLCMHRNSNGEESPKIRKIRVMPILS